MKTVLELEELANLAIKAALAQQWNEAIALNHEYLTDAPESVEALNRLARAYQEISNPEEAKKTYQRVLDIDPYNAIAQKNLTKLEQGAGLTSTSTLNQSVFLEEPGKTRSTSLIQPQARQLERLAPGEQLWLEERQGRLAVTSKTGALVGFIEDELGGHLLNLMHLGNTYDVHVMSVSETPQVFLREVSQSPQAAKFISFARTHNHTINAVTRSDSAADGFGLDAGMPDEDTDNWDDNQDETDSDPDDDFNSVSLDALREEEEGSYSSMHDEY